jgi:hypothetical protein
VQTTMNIMTTTKDDADSDCGRSELRKGASRCQYDSAKKFSLTLTSAARSECAARSRPTLVLTVGSQLP